MGYSLEWYLGHNWASNLEYIRNPDIRKVRELVNNLYHSRLDQTDLNPGNYKRVAWSFRSLETVAPVKEHSKYWPECTKKATNLLLWRNLMKLVQECVVIFNQGRGPGDVHFNLLVRLHVPTLCKNWAPRLLVHNKKLTRLITWGFPRFICLLKMRYPGATLHILRQYRLLMLINY